MNLYGVWAMNGRRVEQLVALNKEVLTFGKERHAYAITSHENPERGQYRRAVEPGLRRR